jgi:hypothetical protein|nr:MAG TPA: hypothetical protein [Caudoviricetes sp.]
MFNNSTTRRLLAIENEQRAQKVATPLNYGQLTRHEIPSATWSGFISSFVGKRDVVAEWEVIFQRTDGIKMPPLVQLSYSHEQSPHIDEGMSGRDPHAEDEYGWWLQIKETGEDYTKFTIIIDSTAWFFQDHDGAHCDLSVQATSTVPGNLSIRRLQ